MIPADDPIWLISILISLFSSYLNANFSANGPTDVDPEIEITSELPFDDLVSPSPLLPQAVNTTAKDNNQ